MPSELSEQIFIVKMLRRANLLFCAIPNGGYRQRKEARNLKLSGVVPGAPDLLIFDPPPERSDRIGTALEMKKQGGRPSSLSKAQKVWLTDLEGRGWAVVVGYGWQDAAAKLKGLGYLL